MSSALDLAGSTHTITTDTTETYFTVTDSVGGGTLILKSGSSLLWDDSKGCGFLATTQPFTLQVDGTAENPATIASVEDVPHHYWTLPPITCTINATRCNFRDCTGAHGSTWTLNNCEWGGDQSYCTVTDVRSLTNIPVSGTLSVSDGIINTFIKNATDEINDLTGRRWDRQTLTDEEYDWDGKEILHLRNFPVLSISSVKFRTGNEYATDWTTMTLDPTDGDYWYSADDLENGQIRLLEAPQYKYSAVRVTYDYGYDPVPNKIRKLCAYMAAVDSYKATAGVGSPCPYESQITWLRTEVEKMISSFGTELDIFIAPFDQERTRYKKKMYPYLLGESYYLR